MELQILIPIVLLPEQKFSEEERKKILNGEERYENFEEFFRNAGADIAAELMRQEKELRIAKDVSPSAKTPTESKRMRFKRVT